MSRRGIPGIKKLIPRALKNSSDDQLFLHSGPATICIDFEYQKVKLIFNAFLRVQKYIS